LARGPSFSGGVNLVGPEERIVAAAGDRVRRSRTGTWTIDFSDVALRKELDDLLPRVARELVVPEVVDLIPAGSWFASLANLLVASSWNALKNPFIESSGVCGECGDPGNLEGHEKWHYDPASAVQSLEGIRCLCSRCHATQHLGRANVVGNFGGVFNRLCALNRIEPWEEQEYRDAIFSLFEQRSRIEWAIDVSDAVATLGHLSLKADVLFAGDGWIHRPAKDMRDDTAVRLVGCDIGFDGKRLVLVPEGDL